MTFLNGLLPFAEKKDHSQPILPKSKDEIRLILDETAQFKRLASKTINTPEQQQYFLEPIAKELLDVLQNEEERPKLVTDDSTNTLKLLSIGKLTIEEDDTEEEDELNKRIKETPYALDIEQYKERRKIQENTIILSQSPLPSPPVVSEDVTMTEALENVATSSTEQALPPKDTDNVAMKIHSLPGLRVVDAEEYTPNTQDLNNMIESILGPESATDNTQAETTEATAEIPAIPTPAVSKPTTPAISEPTTPAVTEPTEVTPVIEKSDFAWIQDNEFVSINEPSVITPSTKKVYSFPKNMVPAFPTIEQQKECNETAEAAKTKTNIFFNIHFEKSINSLNFPSNDMDYSLEEQWDLSGKLMVLKKLLNNLLGNDTTLLIVAKDLGEEETLIDLISNVFQLDCLRLHYVLEESDGGYGVFVKTLKKVDQMKDTVERGNNFEAIADLIISMDIRISSDKDIFKMVTKKGSSDKQVNPPAVWLIAIGSVEHRAFNFLMEHNIPFSDSKSDAFKDLVRQENEWPKDENNSIEKLNNYVADNVKSWLLTLGSNTKEYQFRSTLQLPRSILLGNIKVTAPVTVENEETPSDMDIDSDTDETQPRTVPDTTLSDQGTEFINNILFPPFDISKGELTPVNTEQLLSALPVSDLQTLNTLPKNIQTEYREEVNNLKRQYEQAFNDLQQKFREKAFSSMQK